MITFNFPSAFITRIQEYLSSKEYSEMSSYSKSDYWEYHSGKITVKFSGDKVTVFGEAGNYFPPKANIAEKIKRKINRIKILAKPKKIKLLNIFEAYDKVMDQHPISVPILSKYRINFKDSENNQKVIKSIREMHKRFHFKNKTLSD